MGTHAIAEAEEVLAEFRVRRDLCEHVLPGRSRQRLADQ
jgi:hypothetical protein